MKHDALRGRSAPRVAGLVAAVLVLTACGGKVAVDGDANGDGGCGCGGCFRASFQQATTRPSLYFLVDRSESMREVWPEAVAALTQFFEARGSAGVSAALDLFPAGIDCLASDYAVPDVPFGPLDPLGVQSNRLVEGLESAHPGGQTPLYAAYSGALATSHTHAETSSTGGPTAVVIVTDGVPNVCAAAQNDAIPDLAANALSKSPPVRTFTIGLDGANQAALHEIAEAGDGQSIMLERQALGDSLLGALGAVQSALSCRYQLHGVDDPSDVVVRVTIERDDASQDTFEVADSESCALGGWFLDASATPPRIELCPKTCAAVTDAAPDATVRLESSCR